MNQIKIKVCGMRDPGNIRRLAELKPDLLGLVFYPHSPRYAGASPADGMFDSFPHGILKTGVFVDEDLKNINEHVLNFGLQAVQLHGNESPEMCIQLKSTGVKVIKAFSIDDTIDFSKMTPYISGCDWFLFDTFSKIPGGSGKRFNWNVLEKYDLVQPFFLSGGIGPEDAERILKLNHTELAGVDINSRFETRPGLKDIEQVGQFILKIRSNQFINY